MASSRNTESPIIVWLIILGIFVLSLVSVILLIVIMSMDAHPTPKFKRSYQKTVPEGNLNVIVEFHYSNYELNDTLNTTIDEFINDSWPNLSIQDALRILHDELSQHSDKVSLELQKQETNELISYEK